MSDVTPKKRPPQRPAAPLWAARRRLRSDTSEARGSGDTDGRSSALPPEPPPALAAPARVPRPAVPRTVVEPEETAARLSEPEPEEAPDEVEEPELPRRATVPPAPPIVVEAEDRASAEPEAVSLREIETLLSPGKVPPRLPATSARVVASRAGAPPLAKPIAPAPPAAPRLHATEPARVAAKEPVRAPAKEPARMPAREAPRVPAKEPARPAFETSRAYEPPPPPAATERPLPNPLESSAADLELMAAIAAVPSKRPENKPAWAPPKAPVQAKAQTVAVLSSEAVAALKGAKPATPASNPRAGSSPAIATRGTPLRPPPNERTATNERSATNERTGGVVAKPSGLLVPPPPVRVGPPRRVSVPDAAALDAAWDAAEDAKDEAAKDAREGAHAEAHAAAPADGAGASAEGARLSAAENARAVNALDMRRGAMQSLVDPVELLRDAPPSSRPKGGRGSVVDPLELYGAVTPAPPKPVEQSLPKVMVQMPAKAADDRATAAAITAASVRTAAAIAEAEAKSRAALAAAEARATAASDEASGALKPKVDLPPRIEPRPFPKPPPRKPGALGAGDASKAASKTEPAKVDVITAPAAAKSDAGRLVTRREGDARGANAGPASSRLSRKSLDPAAIWDVGPLDEELGDDEIQVDITPDTPETSAALSGSEAGPKSDSGRFDLHQLMSSGPKSTKKGLADADIFSLAGDLFTETASGKIVPPDLSALPKRGRSAPPPPDRMLAPVAIVAAPAVPRVTLSGPDTQPRPVAGGRLRIYLPWLLLPVVALAVAALMVWRGQPATPDRTATDPTHAGSTDTAPPRPVVSETQPRIDAPPPATATTTAAGDTSDKPAKGDSSGAPTAWKPPSGTTASTTTTAATAPTATTPATATSTSKAPETPPPSGNEFNASAARSALRNAAGAAAGCPADKPGQATVSITFAPSGRVTSSVVSGGFAGTTTGGCIASAMRGATVPPFDGGPVSVVWKVTLR